MMDAEKKKVPIVLSTEDIRKQAQNWSLAGDVGLLAHLEQFSEKICTKTQEAHIQFNELVDNYDEVQKKIDNTTNQFLALQNCQFVENRVYDEETPSEENKNEKIVDDDERERLLLIQYKEAVEIGIKLLDTHFEEVELPPNSDSDEEEENNSQNISLTWKPKNPYSRKKFPLLIGSAEWWEDDKVGLGDFKEYPDTEKVVSDSESDVEINHEFDEGIQISSSSSVEYEKSVPSRSNTFLPSSEDLFGLQSNYNFNSSTSDLFGATANSLQREPQNILPKIEDQISSNNEIKEHLDDEISSKIDESEIENPINKLPKDNNAFKRELAAKLSSFTKGEDSISANEKSFKVDEEEKFQKNHSDSKDLFVETEESDLFSGKMKDTVIGSRNLFFETESDTQLFGGSNTLFSESGSNLFNSDSSENTKTIPIKSQEVLSEKKNKEFKKPAPAEESAKDIFGDVDDDDDTLFFSKPISAGLASESLSSSESDIFRDKKPSVFHDTNKNQTAKTKDLFFEDFEDDLTASDIFAVGTNKEKNSALSLNKNIEKPDLFSKDVSRNDELAEDINSSVQKSLDNSLATVFESKASAFPIIPDYSNPTNQNLESGDSKSDLFSDYATDFSAEKKALSDKLNYSLDDDESSLFLERPKQPDTISISSSRSSLFDEGITSKSRLASVFEKDKSNKFDDDLFSGVDNSLFGDNLLSKVDENDLFAKKPNNTSKKNGKVSLFDDYDDTEDLFKDTKDNEDIFAKTLRFPNASNKDEKSHTLFHDGKEEKQNSSKKPKENDIIDGAAPNKVDFLQKSFNRHLADDFKVFPENVPSNLNQTNEENFSKTRESENIIEKLPTETAVAGDLKKAEESKVNLLQETDPSLSKLFPQEPLSVDRTELFTEQNISQDFANSKPKPPDTLNLHKDLTISQNNSRSKNVGKLNIPQNLKSKLEAAVKPISSEVNVTLHVEEAVTVERENKIDNSDKSFEPPSNLLKCPSKDRVKIPTRRRPQSRRARQEAIRNSGANFSNTENVKSINESTSAVWKTNSLNVSQPKDSESSKNSPDSIFSSPLSHPLSPSTDEEDFFNVPELDTNFEKEDHSIFQSDLFHPRNNKNEDENLLFEDAPILSPLSSKKDKILSNSETKGSKSEDAGLDSLRSKPKPNETKIFDFDDVSDEDDDSLFKSKDVAKNNSKTGDFASFLGEKAKMFKSAQINKEPLFDIKADESDDLFGNNFENTLAELPAKSVEKTTAEKSQSENKTGQLFDDPLGLMSNRK